MPLKAVLTVAAFCLACVAHAEPVPPSAVPVTVEGDEFDPQKIVRGPVHEQGLITWQIVAVKKSKTAAAVTLIVEFSWVDNGLLDLGNLTGASFKGGTPAKVSVGTPTSDHCNSVGCLYSQSLNVSLPTSVLKAHMEPDGLALKIHGTKYAEVVVLPANEVSAVIDVSKAL